METILITGGTGFLGGSLVRRLARSDCRLVLLVRNKNVLDGDGLGRLLSAEECRGNGAGNAGVRAHSGRIELVEGDITQPCLGIGRDEYLRLAGEVDTVFHCAARTDFDNEEALLRTNVTGTRNVLSFAIAERPKRYHHISSAYVVGKAASVDDDKSNNTKRFNNVYEETKFIGESLVSEHISSHGLRATVYRPSIIVGDSWSGYTKVFRGMYSFARAIYLASRHTNDEPFRIFGDREAAINLVPVDYVADSIVAIAGNGNNKTSVGRIFNVTNPNPPTLGQLNAKIARALGIRASEIVPLTDRLTLNSLERFYLSYTRPYLPYVHKGLSFDSSGTRELLEGTDIVCPRMSQRLISLLIDFAVRNNWGVEVEKIEPVPAGAS